MPSQTVKLNNETGLHARPARVFSKKAAEFDADVRIRKTSSDADAVNAKSALSVLTLDCSQGDEIEIVAEGDDADDAVATLVEIVEDGLGE